MKSQGKRGRPGFTLLEVMVSCVIAFMVFGLVYRFVQLSRKGYEDVAHQAHQTANARTAFDILRQDLRHYRVDLPMTLGNGKESAGWAFVNQGYANWTAGYGSLCSSQEEVGFPNDRIGFFIDVSERAADKYEGRSIAHVLYFTAITQDGGREDLTPASSEEQLGYSRKLYRLYTPPDRVFERLKLLNPVIGHGDFALPRGPFHLTATVKPDDAEWGIIASPAILSLVATEVAQFSVTLRGETFGETGMPRFVEDLSAELPGTEAATNVHSLLLSGGDRDYQLTPSVIKVDLRLCPVGKAVTLSVRDWKTKVGERFIAREGLAPNFFTLTHKLKR